MLKKVLLSLILLIANSLSLSAQTVLDEPVDFLVENEKISEALFSLSELADVNITFSPKFFKKDKKVSVTAEDKPLKLVLRKCLEGTEISFQFSEGGIVLFRKIAKKHTLSGYLSDAQTGERLVGANIFELTSSLGGASNAYGFYSQKFKQGKVKLQISYLGYQTEIIEVDLKESQSFNIALEPSLTLTEVVITAQKDSVLTTAAGVGTTLPLERLAHLPHAAGEADVMRYIQMLPGVQSGADGFGGLHVRGGNSDQNLILMDDVPVYNPSHTFGLFSIFNPDLAKSVKFFKSGFPARYDGRLSSVLDVRTREGNDQKISTELSVGMMATKGIVEIPLGRGAKGGLLLAGRKTHINSWLKPLSKKTKAKAGLVGEMNYQFADFNAKAHYTLGQKDKIYLSYYVGKDKFLDTEEVELEVEEDMVEGAEFINFGFSSTETRDYTTDWGNNISSLRWNHLFNDKLFSNTTLTFSNFFYDSDKKSEVDISIGGVSLASFQGISHYGSHISDMSFRTDFDYFLNEFHHFRFGLNATNRKFIPGFSETRFRGVDADDFPIIIEDETTSVPSIRTNELNFYLEDEYQRNNLRLNIGLHLSTFVSSERKDFIPQPRLSATYSFSEKLKINATAARTTQFLHLITKTDSGLPEDLWVPVGAKTPPPSAWQVSLGASGKLGAHSSWRTEFYAKRMQNVLQIKQETFQSTGDSFVLDIDATNREDFVEKGSGETYGVETTFEQQRGKLTGWLSYSYAVSNRIFNGEKTPYSFDSRHGITVATVYQLNNVIDFSMSWLYQSGRPMLENSNFDNNNVPFSSILGQNTIPKSDRLPDYHRLDAGINLSFNKKRLKHKIHLGVYNAYNRKNVFFTYPTIHDDQVGVVNSLPILPSFSYGIKF